MTNSTDFLIKIPKAVKIQEKISLIILSVLFIAGCLIWTVFCCLKMPVKQFTRYCSDFFLIKID